jgi:ferredoxin
MENRKIALVSFLACLLVAFGGWYLVKQKNSEINSTSDQADPSDDSTISVVDQVVTAKTSLTVLTDRCRGCGKCALIDPEHFSASSHQITVISQENLNSTELAQAQSRCEHSAIKIM